MPIIPDWGSCAKSVLRVVSDIGVRDKGCRPIDAVVAFDERRYRLSRSQGKYPIARSPVAFVVGASVPKSPGFGLLSTYVGVKFLVALTLVVLLHIIQGVVERRTRGVERPTAFRATPGFTL